MSLGNNTSRGIFHFHSRFSFDSISSIQAIADRLESLYLDFAVLTDHNNVRGSIELRKELARRNSSITVPLAAEYSSSVGDIIVVGIADDLSQMPPFELIDAAKQGGGLVILPHPFDGHLLSDELIERVDAIEVFNGRSTAHKNLQSESLASQHHKPVIYASDAHLLQNLGNVIITIPRGIDFESAVRQGKVELETSIFSPRSDIFYSQVIKSYKKRDLGLFFRLLLSLPLSALKRRFPSIFSRLRSVKNKL